VGAAGDAAGVYVQAGVDDAEIVGGGDVVWEPHPETKNAIVARTKGNAKLRFIMITLLSPNN
jgi:hypothetical protein